jgi:hypothetical protein
VSLADALNSPLSRRIDRVLPADDGGPVYTFDIDKTYLDTRFTRARDILRIPLELAIDKRPFPGVADLIRAVQRGSPSVGHDRPVFFVSASPAQMRPVLERRMVLDEIAVDGITLKNWTYFLRKARIAALKEQLFYKLLALLVTRCELPLRSYEILFGDDSESDAYIYSVYSAVVTRKLVGHALERVLEAEGVERRERALILHASDRLDDVFDPERDEHAVRHIFIHQVTHRPEPRVYPHGVRPMFYAQALQPAAVLYRAGLIRGSALSRIYAALRKENAFVASEVGDSVAETLGPSGEWQQWLADPSGAGWP